MIYSLLCVRNVYVYYVHFVGLASLYKEKSIIDYSLPTDIHTLSCWLFFYQFLFALFCFPIFYLLQGKHDDSIFQIVIYMYAVSLLTLLHVSSSF